MGRPLPGIRRVKIQSHLYGNIEQFITGVDQRPTLKIYDKSASTNSVSFSAMDAKRADKKYVEYYYEPLGTNGEIVNKSGATVDWT